MSVLNAATICVVMPRLSLRPAVEKTFWLMPVSLLSLYMAPLVSILDLKSLKCMYFLRAYGFIFRSFLLKLSRSPCPFSIVVLSILVNFSLTKVWILMRSSRLFGKFFITVVHSITFSPVSSFSYNCSIYSAMFFPRTASVSASNYGEN